ncbi:MAG: DUF4199 domain-containing protein [Devosia sp.]
MLRIASVYGGIAGFIVIASGLVIFAVQANRHLAGSEWLGYLVMILAFTLIFVGMKRYRDRDLGGVIRFLPAFGIGLLMAIFASVIYVVVWEVYVRFTGDAFINAYAATVVEKMQASGATAGAIAAKQAELDQMIAAYANPLFRIPVTFSEIFPVGFIVALISALLLRNPRILPARSATPNPGTAS